MPERRLARRRAMEILPTVRPAVSSGNVVLPGSCRCSSFEIDPHACETEHLGGSPLDLLELVANGAPLQEIGGDVREQRRLTPPLLHLDVRRRERAASSLTTIAVPE